MFSALVGCLMAEARPLILRLYARYDGPVGTVMRVGVMAAALGVHACTLLAIGERKVYNVYHPFTSWVPICLFICLRNATPYLRGTYASGLALMGRHSLELYLLQFHVSAAASSSTLVDTRDCKRQRRLRSPLPPHSPPTSPPRVSTGLAGRLRQDQRGARAHVPSRLRCGHVLCVCRGRRHRL